MLVTSHALSAFLAPTRYIDHDDSDVRALVDGRGWRRIGSVAAARAAFEFVRDEVRHSWDIRSHRVTRTASNALAHSEGLCFAKSHLLAAILRQLGVPSGLAYQRLTLGDMPESGYSVHGLNTAFVGGRWIRIDARGNKPGVDAQFSLGAERLAFRVRPEMDERDYDENFSDVHPTIARALESEDDLHVLVERLPNAL
jgi:transglutaminase-like putative cysteine protease